MSTAKHLNREDLELELSQKLSIYEEIYGVGKADEIKPKQSLYGLIPVSYTHLDVYKRQTDARINVISVMPETGFVPTIAMAFAATVVNRKAIPATNRIATTVCSLSLIHI